MSDGMKDWPMPLRLNAAAATLAPKIWFARLEAFGLPYRHWAELDGPTRQQYIDHAAAVLRAVRPAPASMATVRRDDSTGDHA